MAEPAQVPLMLNEEYSHRRWFFFVSRAAQITHAILAGTTLAYLVAYWHEFDSPTKFLVPIWVFLSCASALGYCLVLDGLYFNRHEEEHSKLRRQMICNVVIFAVSCICIWVGLGLHLTGYMLCLGIVACLVQAWCIVCIITDFRKAWQPLPPVEPQIPRYAYSAVYIPRSPTHRRSATSTLPTRRSETCSCRRGTSHRPPCMTAAPRRECRRADDRVALSLVIFAQNFAIKRDPISR
jgi:hypothetical protein